MPLFLNKILSTLTLLCFYCIITWVTTKRNSVVKNFPHNRKKMVENNAFILVFRFLVLQTRFNLLRNENINTNSNYKKY